MTEYKMTVHHDITSRNAQSFTNIMETHSNINNKITIEKANETTGRRANAKSLLGVLSLTVKAGDEVILRILDETDTSVIEALSTWNQY